MPVWVAMTDAPVYMRFHVRRCQFLHTFDRILFFFTTKKAEIPESKRTQTTVDRLLVTTGLTLLETLATVVS